MCICTSAPDILRVDSSNVDVLNNDVGNAISQTQTLALDHARCALADDTLVALDTDGSECRLVVVDGDLWRRALEVGAPIVCDSLVSDPGSGSDSSSFLCLTLNSSLVCVRHRGPGI